MGGGGNSGTKMTSLQSNQHYQGGFANTGSSNSTNPSQAVSAAGRKTFYISDYQKAKQQREWHQLNSK